MTDSRRDTTMNRPRTPFQQPKAPPEPMHEVIRIPVWANGHYSYVAVAIQGELTDEVIDKLLRYLEFMRDLLSPSVGIRSDNTDAEKLIP